MLASEEGTENRVMFPCHRMMIKWSSQRSGLVWYKNYWKRVPEQVSLRRRGAT